tara:strand:- start:224 stop:397 length:174 start_codon:yes stop_codon:yes gene_type:complete
MAKKKKYTPPKTDKKELEEFKKHSKIIEEKIKAISETYRKWWDKDKGTWKEGYKDDS